MKRQNKKLPSFGSLTKLNLFLTLLPALLWVGATTSRQVVISPHCIQSTNTCSKESVLAIDQLSLGMEDEKADAYSYMTQNLSGILAVTVPPIWNGALFFLGRLNPVAALSAVVADWMLVLQTSAWNGFLTETSHLLSQRPRPFVYSDPNTRGIDPAHYTSFYSGHTSFSAAATTILFLILLSRGAPLFILILSAVAFETLVLSTAYFRILAGRHFLTDVLCGAIAGIAVAGVVYTLRRKTRRAGPDFA